MQTSVDQNVVRPYAMNFDYHKGGVEIDDLFISAKRLFAESELVFEGHFPMNKILPGVMLVEYALYMGREYLSRKEIDYSLNEIKSAMFISPVFPGHEVECSCRFKKLEGSGKETLEMRALLSRGEVECAKVRCIYGSRM